MTVKDMKATVNRWLDAFNSGNLVQIDQAADDCYTADCIMHDPGIPNVGIGPEGVKQWIRGLLQRNSAFHSRIEDMFGEGDRLAVRFTFTRTRRETGKMARLSILVISRFVDGKIAEEWELVGPPEEIAAPETGQVPLAVVKAMDAASNAGDLADLMTHFAENAVLKEPIDGKLLTGKAAIQDWFQPQMHRNQVDSRNHQVTGDTVTWDATVTGELVRQGGLQARELDAAAVVKAGLITSFSLTVTSTRA